jgi:outer membrane protein TolC
MFRNNRIIKIIIGSLGGFFISFLILPPVNAQVKKFTLEEAIMFALENNRDVIIADMTVKKADAAVDEAFGYALPSVDLSASFSHFMKKPKMAFPDFEALLGNATYSILFDENVIPRDNSKFKPVATALQSFVQTNNYETKVQVTQTLFNSTVFKGIGASKIYSDLSKEEYSRTVSNIVLNVEKAFYGVLLTKKLLEITNASYNNALENLRNVKALNEQGLVSDFDALQAEVQVENIRPVVLQMENTLKNAKDGFKIVLGISPSKDVDVDGEFLYQREEVPDEAETITTALQRNYGLKSLELKKQVDEAFIDLDRSEYWPALYAFGNYSYAGSSDQFKFQNYSSAIVGLTFSMNLFRGGQTKNRVQQSTISYLQTEQQFLQLKDFIATGVKSKLLELRRVKELLDAQERNVRLAERAYDIAVVRYKEGTGNQLEVQNADMSLRQARINKLQIVYDYIIAKAELNQLLGNVSPQFLQ